MPGKITEEGAILVSLVEGGSGGGATEAKQDTIIAALADVLTELQTANNHLAAIEANTTPTP